MSTNIRNVVKLYQNLKQEWNKKPPNLPKCGECLSELKLALTELTFLPSNDENATKQVRLSLHLAQFPLRFSPDK